MISKRKYENDEVAEINRQAIIVNGHAVWALDYIRELQRELGQLREDALTLVDLKLTKHRVKG
jgi:hypothetical protein